MAKWNTPPSRPQWLHRWEVFRERAFEVLIGRCCLNFGLLILVGLNVFEAALASVKHCGSFICTS